MDTDNNIAQLRVMPFSLARTYNDIDINFFLFFGNSYLYQALNSNDLLNFME